MEFSDIQLFIKNNCKIVSLNVDYTNDGDIYNYVINIQGINHKLQLSEDGDIIKLVYNDNTFTDDNEIQLELFELLNYKNIEYIDCYIIKKRNIDNYAMTCEDIGFKPETTLFINCLNKFNKEKTFEANSNTTIQASYTTTEDYNKTCEDIGFKPKTKKFKECIARFKGESYDDSSKARDLVDSEDKNMGQIGTVIAIKKKDKSVVFASKIEEEISKGSTVKILTDKKHITATITNHFDGYYSASVEKIDAIKLGNKVIILN